jgi:hypothetical protein
MPGVPKPMRILAPIEFGNIHQTILFNDTFVCKYFCRTHCINEYYWFNVYFKVGWEVVCHSVGILAFNT